MKLKARLNELLKLTWCERVYHLRRSGRATGLNDGRIAADSRAFNVGHRKYVIDFDSIEWEIEIRDVYPKSVNNDARTRN